ncbi:MAG: hypothetical protein EOM40_00005 [Clostridia bacterium]|nr:hypothetical protein [Clostridia bacterium]
MKLSAAYIIYKLKKHIRLSEQAAASLAPVLKAPYFQCDFGDFQEGGIYIYDGKASSFDHVHLPSNLLIFCLKDQKLPSLFSKKSIVFVLDDTDFVTLYNLLQSIFNEITKWQEAIMNSRLNGESIQQLLALSAPLFENSMVVIGMDFTVVAAQLFGDHFYQETVFGSSDTTYPYVTELKQDELYNAVREKEGFFYYPNKTTGTASLCVNLKKFGKTTHRLLLLEDLSPIDSCYGFLLEELARMIEHAFSHNAVHRTVKDMTLHSIIQMFLTDRTSDYVTISQKLDNLGWYSRHEYECLVLQTTYMDQENLTAKATCNYLENIIPHSCAVLHSDNIVVFINHTLSQEEQGDYNVSDKIIYFIRDSLMKAGFSRLMVGHLNLRRQYVQARIALELGNKKNPSKWIHHFNDISFDYILEQATKKLPGYMISHEKLLKLKIMDENNDTDYMHTLELYLDNHLNAVKTARELFIHRSTFLYRLDKIKEIL